MKRSLSCPKCGGKKIWVLEKFRIPSDVATGQELPVVPHQAGAAGARLLARIEPRGHFDVYACHACGYSELYAGGLDRLTPDPANGIRLVDASVPPKGPFR